MTDQFCSVSSDAYDPLDPTANITIKWDLMRWTDDGYIASVTGQNFQQYRHVESPGWSLGWSWATNEVIWSLRGAQATEEGDCSAFIDDPIPHSCSRNPNIVDMLPTVNDSSRTFSNCCRGGLLSSWVQDPPNSMSAFEIKVGRTGNNNRTIQLPKNFSFMGPGPGYSCGPAEIVERTVFPDPEDKRRSIRAAETWKVTCIYSQFLASKSPGCCVSLSSFYSEAITPCNDCSCGCSDTGAQNCVSEESKNKVLPLSNPNASFLYCTKHMCPIRIHWHVKVSYKAYWRVKITVTNFDYNKNHTNWNLVIQHPDLDQLSQVYSFEHQALRSSNYDDTVLFWGKSDYNDMLLQANPEEFGVVQTELLIAKDEKRKFSFKNGYAFPRRVYFNGDNCMMPPPDSYPRLPHE